MDELACFAPGMLALGSSGYDDPTQAKKFLTVAEEVKLCLQWPLVIASSVAVGALDFIFVCFPLICSLHGHVITFTNQHQQN